MVESRPFELEVDGRVVHGLADFPAQPGRRPVILVCHGFKGFFDWGFYPPLVDLLSPSATYKVAFSAAGSYLSYIIPAPDIHHDVSVLSGPVGDHYEDSVTASSTMGAVLQEAQMALGYDD